VPRKYLSSKLIKLILATIFCLVLIFFVSPKVFRPARLVIAEIAYPFEKSFYVLGKKIRDGTDLLASISSLKKDNDSLLQENDSLKSQIAALSDQKNENAVLREQLKLSPREKYNLAAAFVIGEDPKGLGSWITLDKGQADGIRTGMPVIVSDGILIGKIGYVYGNSSQVILITNSESSVNANDPETGARGIVRGAYGLGLVLDMVEQSDTLTVGNNIATSGLGGVFPPGLLIGKIQQTMISADKLFQQAIITPGAKYSKLDMAFIIKN
jgi:rod shape-determining protein MreC